jgi:hypothetical protein
LHDTATVFVSADVYTLHHASIEDKLSVEGSQFTSWHVKISWMLGSFEDHEECLDDMISMHVHYELNNIFVEGSNYLEHAIVRKALHDEWLISLVSLMIIDDFLSQLFYKSL